MTNLFKIQARTPLFTTCKLGLVALAVAGCVSTSRPGVGDRITGATQMTAQHGWVAQDITGNDFTLRSYGPKPFKTDILRVYIEGDGFAWADRATPSRNPTPINPMALKMAMADAKVPSVYLARPCQFNESCTDRKWWTNGRFGPEVILDTSAAIDELKTQYGAKHIELVGYSGGGVVAALVAARRRDVDVLITVAAPLNTQAWVEHHGISPLTGSFNSAEFAGVLMPVKQMHFVGSDDKVVPEAVVRAFTMRTQPNPSVRVMQGYSHTCCWAENWADITSTLDMSAAYAQYTDD